MDRLNHRLETGAHREASEAADYMINHMKTHWSRNSPSSPYNPPAKVTGELSRSIKKEQARSSGRFTSAFNVNVTAVYAAAQEFGYSPRNLKPRPYFFNAFNATEQYFVNRIKGLFLGW